MGEVLLPLTPAPSPLPGARGVVRDFVAIKNTKSPPRPRRGRGVGGEGARHAAIESHREQTKARCNEKQHTTTLRSSVKIRGALFHTNNVFRTRSGLFNDSACSKWPQHAKWPGRGKKPCFARTRTLGSHGLAAQNRRPCVARRLVPQRCNQRTLLVSQ